MYNDVVHRQIIRVVNFMIAERLKIARKRRKMTQEELAKLTNTTKSTISNYENSYSSPAAEMIVTLSEALHTSTDYLLGKTDSPEMETTKKYNSIDDLINSQELHQWLYDLIENNPESITQMKKVWDVIGDNNNEDKKTT